MRWFGRFIGLLLVIVFVLVFPCSMWTFNTQTIALSEDTYKNLFADEGFYQEMIPVVLPDLLEDLVPAEALQPGEMSLAVAIEQLDYQDWEPIAPSLVPASWVKNEVDSNLDNFFRWLDGDRDELTLVFHTTEIAQRLASQEGADAVRRIAATLPACTPPEERQFALCSAARIEGECPYCRPQVPRLVTALENKLSAARLTAAQELAARGDIDVVAEVESHTQQAAKDQGDELPDDAFSQTDLSRFRSTVRLWQRLLVLVFLIPAAILSLIVIVTVRSAKSFFRWMGWPLVLGSLLTLVPLSALPFLLNDLRVEYGAEVEQGFANGGALVAEIMSNGMMRLVVGEFTWPVLIQAAILIALGFAAIVTSVLLPDPDAPAETIVYGSATHPTAPGSMSSATPTRMDGTTPPRFPPSDRTPSGRE